MFTAIIQCTAISSGIMLHKISNMCARYESARLLHGRQWPMKGKLYDNIFLHYKVTVSSVQGAFEWNQNITFSPASGCLVWGRGQNKGSGSSDLPRLCEARPEGDEADGLVWGVAAVPGLRHQLPPGGCRHHVQARGWPLQREREKRRLEASKMIEILFSGRFSANKQLEKNKNVVNPESGGLASSQNDDYKRKVNF